MNVIRAMLPENTVGAFDVACIEGRKVYEKVHDGYLALDEQAWMCVQRHVSPEQQPLARKIMDALPEAAFNLFVVGGPTSGTLSFGYWALRAIYTQFPEIGFSSAHDNKTIAVRERVGRLAAVVTVNAGVSAATSIISGIVNRDIRSLLTVVSSVTVSSWAYRKVAQDLKKL